VPYYFIGKFFSREKITRFVQKYGKYFWYKKEYLDDLYQVFEENGNKIVFTSKFIP
jgi:membrane protein DedA with SNARE-associated domain